MFKTMLNVKIKSCAPNQGATKLLRINVILVTV